MIFFCFSSKDRHTIVESIFYHVTNYSLPVWYDRHEMLLGDERDYKNFEEGVNKSRYAVIILSKNAINSPCACEEIDLIRKRHNNGEMYVFPIFYTICASDLPKEFLWMTKLVYKELDAATDSLSACNHIVSKFLLDELEKYQFQSLKTFLPFCKNKPVYAYLRNLIEAYNSINDSNHDAKISLLYASCKFLLLHYPLETAPLYYSKGVDKLFSETKLHLPIDLRETIIFERLFLLLFNASIFGYII